MGKITIPRNKTLLRRIEKQLPSGKLMVVVRRDRTLSEINGRIPHELRD